MTNKILAIHGAFSTPTVFNYLHEKMPEYSWSFFNYCDSTGDIVELVYKASLCAEPKSRYHLVGHSMGGLMALALCQLPFVISVTTIATPLGGLDLNLFQTFFSRSLFLREISRDSRFVKSLQNAEYTKPIQHIITTAGFSPWIYEPSDGVVTLKSQKAWSAGPQVEISSNHSEVMLNPQTVANLKSFWSAS
jgi:pimeloyl-ACP methyl ester carboxylesterase